MPTAALTDRTSKSAPVGKCTYELAASPDDGYFLLVMFRISAGSSWGMRVYNPFAERDELLEANLVEWEKTMAECPDLVRNTKNAFIEAIDQWVAEPRYEEGEASWRWVMVARRARARGLDVDAVWALMSHNHDQSEESIFRTVGILSHAS